MSKSEQKRICAQSQCIVRYELKRVNEEKDKRIQELKTALLEIVKRFPNEINSSYLYKELFDGSEMIKYRAIAEK